MIISYGNPDWGNLIQLNLQIQNNTYLWNKFLFHDLLHLKTKMFFFSFVFYCFAIISVSLHFYNSFFLCRAQSVSLFFFFHVQITNNVDGWQMEK